MDYWHMERQLFYFIDSSTIVTVSLELQSTQCIERVISHAYTYILQKALRVRAFHIYRYGTPKTQISFTLNWITKQTCDDNYDDDEDNDDDDFNN